MRRRSIAWWNSCMRCRDSLRTLVCAAPVIASFGCLGAAEGVRQEIAARLKRQLPETSPTDYAMGAAAFDAQLRSSIAEHASAAAPVLEAGRKLWYRKFRDGRSLAGCFPNGGRRGAA